MAPHSGTATPSPVPTPCPQDSPAPSLMGRDSSSYQPNTYHPPSYYNPSIPYMYNVQTLTQPIAPGTGGTTVPVAPLPYSALDPSTEVKPLVSAKQGPG
jgi:hypothetical protein